MTERTVIYKAPEASPIQSVNLGTISKYYTNIAPIIVTSFLVMSSVFNLDGKGFVWLILAAIGLVLVWVAQNIIKKTDDPERAKRCMSLWGFGMTIPSSTSFFLSFTLFYFLYPMIDNKDYNFGALAALILLYAMDAVFNFMNRCSSDDWKWNIVSIGAGTGLGALWGLMYYFIKSSISGKLVYFGGKASNGEYCSKPKQQTFKCNVYKNGEIISTI
jgi:hypothetical protein